MAGFAQSPMEPYWAAYSAYTARKLCTRRIHSLPINPDSPNPYQTAATRRPEIDQNGDMKRTAPKPQCKRYTSETIADRDLLVLAILALFRIDARCFLYESETKELDESVTDSVQLIQRPGDPAVPLSALRTFIHAANWVSSLSPGD